MSTTSSLTAQQFLLQQKIDQFQSDVHRVENLVRNARSIMDVIRAKNSLPSAPSLITWSPDVRRAKRQADVALAVAAEKTVDRELKRLDELLATGDEQTFRRELGNFQRELRYLGPIASHVMRKASIHIHAHYQAPKPETATVAPDNETPRPRV